MPFPQGPFSTKSDTFMSDLKPTSASTAMTVIDTDEKVFSQESRKIKRSSMFYFDCVIFQVEDTLYNLPRAKLIEASSVFEDMFALPQASANTAEGTNDDNPIHLEQTSKKDWECLLKLLFNSNLLPEDSSSPNFTFDEWVSALKLATKWDMGAARACAIEKIAQFDYPAKKIHLAREYQVPRYFIPALVRLIARSEPLTREEYLDLGVDCVLKIASIRERCPMTYYGNNSFQDQKVALDASSVVSPMWNTVVNEIYKVFTDHDQFCK
jgi:hypothetical protein